MFGLDASMSKWKSISTKHVPYNVSLRPRKQVLIHNNIANQGYAKYLLV